MSEPTTFRDDALLAYDEVTTALAPGASLATWVSTHVPLEGRRVLDLGAGTGISALALAARGARVTAVDASRSALDILDARIGGASVETVHGDFRDMDLGSTFDAVVLSRNTFFYAQSQADKVETLHVARRHLDSDATLFMDCSDPTEFLGAAGGHASSVAYPLGTDRTVTITQTADKATQQVLTMYMCHADGGGLTIFHEQATWASLAEIRLMAETTDLSVRRVEGSHAGEPYASDSRSMMLLLQPA